jgi:hypothetical protein
MCTDYINRFMLDDLVKSCARYFKISHIWCLDAELGFRTGLFEVVDDTDVVGMVNIAIISNNEVHLYYEHDVDDPVIEVPVPLLTGGEEVVGETEKEDPQDHHVPEENGEEIPDLNAAANDHMSGDDDSEDSMYIPSNTHTLRMMNMMLRMIMKLRMDMMLSLIIMMLQLKMKMMLMSQKIWRK